MVGIIALSVVLSASRGGILVATAINLPLAWRVLPRRRRAWWFTALCAGMALYLSVIGLREIGDKFTALVGPDGVTLSGRVTIWKASLPVIADASPLGSGGNTAEQVYWRTGDTSFSGRTVNHLHSDPLEWLLEFGWVGAAIIGGGLVALVWRLRPPRGSPADPVLYWGGVLGIAHLGLHCCGDFIWNREAIAIAAVILVVIACEGRTDHQQRPTVRTRWLRIALAATGIVLAVMCPRSWRYDIESSLAKEAGEFIQARKKSGLPTNGVVVDRLLACEPMTVTCAVAQARAALDLQERSAERSTRIDQARQALDRAARLAPANATAWVERVRLVTAELRFDRAHAPAHDELASAIDRILVWAPAWPYAQTQILDVIRRVGLGTLPRAHLETLIRRLLDLDQRQPAWFFTSAQQIIGRIELAERLSQRSDGQLARPELTRSGLWWLAQKGTAEQWWWCYQQTLPKWLVLDPPRAVLLPVIGPRATMRIAVTADEARAQSEQLQAAGLPVPDDLSTFLRASGSPWSAWAEAIDLSDAATRGRLSRELSADLYRGWVRAWSDRINAADRAASGDTTILRRDTDPELVSALLQRGVARTAAERERLTHLLQARARPEWITLGSGCIWTWIWVEADRLTISSGERWVGLVLDGTWKGWVRGDVIIDGQPSGLHRIAILAPP